MIIPSEQETTLNKNRALIYIARQWKYLSYTHYLGGMDLYDGQLSQDKIGHVASTMTNQLSLILMAHRYIS